MSNNSASDLTEYLVGKGVSPDGLAIRITYTPAHPFFHDSKERVAVIVGQGVHSEGPCVPAERILKFEKTREVWNRQGEKPVFEGFVKEPPGWFERKCQEAHCEWFIPFVEKIASGECVTIEEIPKAFFYHNKSMMPSSSWGNMHE